MFYHFKRKAFKDLVRELHALVQWGTVVDLSPGVRNDVSRASGDGTSCSLLPAPLASSPPGQPLAHR